MYYRLIFISTLIIISNNLFGEEYFLKNDFKDLPKDGTKELATAQMAAQASLYKVVQYTYY